MIIIVSGTKGIKCQVSDFSLVVDSEKGSKADVVLRTTTLAPIPEFSYSLGGAFSEIIGAGEYEIAGTKVTGIQLHVESTAKEIKTIYVVSMDEIRLCFLGNLRLI